jgi:hypothetical protein
MTGTLTGKASRDDRGAEVDIRGVDELILRCGSFAFSEKLGNSRMQSGIPPSVDSVVVNPSTNLEHLYMYQLFVLVIKMRRGTDC